MTNIDLSTGKTLTKKTLCVSENPDQAHPMQSELKKRNNHIYLKTSKDPIATLIYRYYIAQISLQYLYGKVFVRRRLEFPLPGKIGPIISESCNRLFSSSTRSVGYRVAIQFRANRLSR